MRVKQHLLHENRRGELSGSAGWRWESRGLGPEEKEEKVWKAHLEEIEMHTHRADCVSERRPPPPPPGPHSTAMSQGLPSVDTHTQQSHGRERVRESREPASERVRLSS